MIIFLLIIAIIVIIFAVNNSVQQNNRLKAMTISQIDEMDGYDFEHYVCQLMINQGYSASVTTASNDFGVDVVAKKGGDKYAVQVKRYSSKVSRKAVSDAVAGMNYYKCNKSMVVTNNYYTKGAYELAMVNSCILIDRPILGKWVYEYQNIKDPVLKGIKRNNIDKQKIHKQSEIKSSTKEVEMSVDSIKNDYNYSNENIIIKNEISKIDQEVLAIARKEYPRDKELQDEEYQEQLKAKKFMVDTNNKVLSSIARKEYPKDFCMQKYEYKEQLQAKDYIQSCPNDNKRRKAQREYPHDYFMQEYEYRNQ